MVFHHIFKGWRLLKHDLRVAIQLSLLMGAIMALLTRLLFMNALEFSGDTDADVQALFQFFTAPSTLAFTFLNIVFAVAIKVVWYRVLSVGAGQCFEGGRTAFIKRAIRAIAISFQAFFLSILALTTVMLIGTFLVSLLSAVGLDSIALLAFMLALIFVITAILSVTEVAILLTANDRNVGLFVAFNRVKDQLFVLTGGYLLLAVTGALPMALSSGSLITADSVIISSLSLLILYAVQWFITFWAAAFIYDVTLPDLRDKVDISV